MKQVLIFAVTFFLIFQATAQQTLSLKDATIGQGSYLRPTMPEQLKWKDSKHYVMVRENNLIQFQIGDTKSVELLSLAELNEVLRNKEIKEVSAFPRFEMAGESNMWFRTSGQLVLLNLQNKAIVSKMAYPADANNFDFCKENSSLAFTSGNNLFITDNSGILKVTSDAVAHILNGTSVHRNEFGITKGTFWSPRGSQLAFYRMDETMVGDYPLVDFMAREAELVSIKYPMAGMTSHQVKLGIYNLTTKQTVYMETGEPADHYLTNISWASDEKSIFIAELNREQNYMKLNQYDAASGKLIKTVLEEKGNTYVEPVHSIVFSATDPSKFYYQTQQDGWNHIYLYNTNGEQIAQITRGDWEVTEILGFDPEEKIGVCRSNERKSNRAACLPH